MVRARTEETNHQKKEAERPPKEVRPSTVGNGEHEERQGRKGDRRVLQTRDQVFRIEGIEECRRRLQSRPQGEHADHPQKRKRAWCRATAPDRRQQSDDEERRDQTGDRVRAEGQRHTSASARFPRILPIQPPAPRNDPTSVSAGAPPSGAGALVPIRKATGETHGDGHLDLQKPTAQRGNHGSCLSKGLDLVVQEPPLGAYDHRPRR